MNAKITEVRRIILKEYNFPISSYMNAIFAISVNEAQMKMNSIIYTSFFKKLET